MEQESHLFGLDRLDPLVLHTIIPLRHAGMKKLFRF